MSNSIYQEKYISKNILLNFSFLEKNIDNAILMDLKKKYENKCIADGFIKDDSIEFVKKSNGYIRNNNMSYISYDVVFKCMICKPLPNLILKVKIIENIKPALIVEYHPLSLIIPKQLHKNKSVFNKLKIDDEIEVRIVDIKYKINESEIQGVAVLNTESEILFKEQEDLDFELNDDNDEDDIKDDISDNNSSIIDDNSDETDSELNDSGSEINDDDSILEETDEI